MHDENIDYSDIPEVRKSLKPLPVKEQVTLHVDADVLQWFRVQGKGYQTRINALLRAYMEAHEPK